jgi:hypothetical protein
MHLASPKVAQPSDRRIALPRSPKSEVKCRRRGATDQAAPRPRHQRRGLTQAAAAEKLGINQPKVSALANYKLDGFSVERLMTFLTALDQDVEIVIRKEPRSRAAGRISVVAA